VDRLTATENDCFREEDDQRMKLCCSWLVGLALEPRHVSGRSGTGAKEPWRRTIRRTVAGQNGGEYLRRGAGGYGSSRHSRWCYTVPACDNKGTVQFVFYKPAWLTRIRLRVAVVTHWTPNQIICKTPSTPFRLGEVVVGNTPAMFGLF